MNNLTQENFAYIKYYGDKTKDGVIDLAAAANALSGFNEVIKFFNSKQNLYFIDNSYEIPVKIKEGSWIATIVENPVSSLFITSTSIFAASYLKKAGEKIAENDFKDVSFKKILKKSMNAFVDYIKLKKLRISTEEIDKGKKLVRNGIVYTLITLPNGTQIEIENEFLDWYKKMPPAIVQKIVNPIEEERLLEVAVLNDDQINKETINEKEKSFFIPVVNSTDEDIILPHLQHNHKYKLEGILTRGNQSSNSLGFKYSGHILNCYPESGDVTQFKDSLFKKCIVDCYINRNMKTSLKLDKRPTLIIISSSPIDEDFQFNINF